MTRGRKFYSQKYCRQANNGGRYGQVEAVVPKQLVLLGRFSHACMEYAICHVQIKQVPYFNAFIYAANRQPIGKVEDVFGKLHEFSVSIRLNDPKLMKTFKQSDEFFIESEKLLPLIRFLPKSRNNKNETAKKKSKQHAKNQLKNRGGLKNGSKESSGRAGVGSAHFRAGKGRNFQNKQRLFIFK